VIVTSCFQRSQRPPEWPRAGTTKALATLNLLIMESLEIEEFFVSEIKHTCVLVEDSRRARCSILELRRDPPDPWQFQVRRFMADPTPRGTSSVEAVDE